MDDRSDGGLIAAWSAGDARAFEALVDRHGPALLRHAQSLLGAWRGGEDVVQEVFLRLAKKPPVIPADVRGDPRVERAVLTSWLHQVTRNLCMDTMRSERRRRRREEEVAAVEASDGGIGRVEGDDTRAAVEKGLLRLPEDQREVLALRLFGERSYQEIADITGRKVGTVGWLISIGLKALAAELAPFAGRACDLASDGKDAAGGARGIPASVPAASGLQGGVA